MIRTAARFDGPFARPKPGESGAGELASVLAAGLHARGFAPTMVENQQFAHFFRCRSGEHTYEVMAAYDYDDGGGWEVSCPPVLGWLGKLRGSSEDAELARMVGAIDAVLRAHPGIANLRWYKSYGDGSQPSPTP